MTAAISAYLQEVRARLEAATPGKWLCATKPETSHRVYYIYPDDGSNWIPALETATLYEPGNPCAKGDAKLIASAPTELKLLVECLEVSMKALENVRRSNPFGAWPAVHAADALYDVEKLIAERVKP